MPIIARSVPMGNVIGALAYSTPSPGVASAVRPPGAPASFIARTGSACAICNSRAALCLVAAKNTMTTAAFMGGCFSLDMLGSCICTIAPKLVSAMVFVGTRIGIASPRCVAARVRTRRNAGKSSWKRTVFENEVEGLPVDGLRHLRVFGRIYFMPSNE
jgi:hypothetical protein